MRRIIFKTAAILSFLLCLFLSYSYIRSFLPTHLHFESIDGSLVVLTWEGPMPSGPQDPDFNPTSDKFSGTRTILKFMSGDSDRRFLGFRSVRGGGLFQGVKYHIVFIPYWIII